MSGAASTAQWLTCAGIGTGGGGVVLGLLKLALDTEPIVPYRESPASRPAPVAPPAEAPARHAGPPQLDETHPLIRFQPTRARHSKGPAVTWT